MAKTFEYDKHALDDLVSVVERCLNAIEDNCHSLAVTDCYDLEDGDGPLFDEAMKAVNDDFDHVLDVLRAKLGQPAFSGDSSKKRFPKWAGTGHRVAYWKKNQRIIYLHITHVGSVAPVELNLGVVTGPPPDWAAGI